MNNWVIDMHKIEENNKLGENDLENEAEEKMAKRPPSKYYPTRKEAEAKRKKGQRIYREAGKGYYIRQPKEREKSFLKRIFGV